jgi:hypothetical protein
MNRNGAPDTCTNCGNPAYWTPDNEGYSECCNERINR